MTSLVSTPQLYFGIHTFPFYCQHITAYEPFSFFILSFFSDWLQTEELYLCLVHHRHSSIFNLQCICLKKARLWVTDKEREQVPAVCIYGLWWQFSDERLSLSYGNWFTISHYMLGPSSSSCFSLLFATSPPPKGPFFFPSALSCKAGHLVHSNTASQVYLSLLRLHMWLHVCVFIRGWSQKSSPGSSRGAYFIIPQTRVRKP